MELEPPLFTSSRRWPKSPGMTKIGMALAEGETRGLLSGGEMEDCQTECFHHFPELPFRFFPLLSPIHWLPYFHLLAWSRCQVHFILHRCFALQDVAAEAEKLLALDVRKAVSWHHYIYIYIIFKGFGRQRLDAPQGWMTLGAPRAMNTW